MYRQKLKNNIIFIQNLKTNRMKKNTLLIITVCMFCSFVQAQVMLQIDPDSTKWSRYLNEKALRLAQFNPDPTKWSDADLAKYKSEQALIFSQLHYDQYKWTDVDYYIYQSEGALDIALDLYGRLPEVPKTGEDFADLLDTDGNTKRIADYSGNKYLLLNFWKPCAAVVASLPELKEISETYSDKLTIISIGIDEESGWKEFIATHDISGVHLRDSEYEVILKEARAMYNIPLNLRPPKNFNGLSATYSVTGTPTFVMISPEGKIVKIWDGYSKGSLKRRVDENIE